jgi:hypothetical protein
MTRNRWLRVALLVVSMGMAVAIPAFAADVPPKAETFVKADIPDGVYIRILAFANIKQQWSSKGYTAQDLLKMIEELKPDVLDRFIDGKQNLDLKVPVAKGSPEMTELQFLQAAVKAGAPGCTISPKIHLNDIWSQEYRMAAAKQLRDLPLTPRITMVDLDSWFTRRGDAAGNKAMLQKLRDLGYTQMITNPGPYKSCYGYESSVMTYMSGNWKTPQPKIEALHRKGVKLPLLHIDYPAEIGAFHRLKPDRQADIIMQCSADQYKMGFRFIYPVRYEFRYDSTKSVTSKDGRYKGVTVFEVIKQAIEMDRKRGPVLK